MFMSFILVLLLTHACAFALMSSNSSGRWLICEGKQCSAIDVSYVEISNDADTDTVMILAET